MSVLSLKLYKNICKLKLYIINSYESFIESQPFLVLTLQSLGCEYIGMSHF